MIEHIERAPVTVYKVRCMVCGECWTRAAHSREEIEEYLRMRDVCVRGRHVYEHGRMIDNVRVTVWS